MSGISKQSGMITHGYDPCKYDGLIAATAVEGFPVLKEPHQLTFQVLLC